MHKLFILCSFFLFACNNNKDPNTVTLPPDSLASSQTVHANAADTIVTSSQPMVLSGCYEMVMKKDTATLELQVKDTTVAGKLNFHFFEKDRNEGQLTGVVRNDRIIADYTFKSEGMTSVREVVFKIKDHTLLQGFGDLKEVNGKLIFTNKNDLQFHTDNPFIKVDCPQAN
jgi:hypothetical protein